MSNNMEEEIKKLLIERRSFYSKMIAIETNAKQMDFLRGKIAAIADLYYMIDRIERGDVNV